MEHQNPEEITPSISDEQTIYTVSSLNEEARAIIEENFQHIWVCGEISNLSRPSSGHVYFSLKDERAQVRCAFFRHAQRHLTFTPENGQHVLLRAQVSLYQARGDFQLIIREMQLAGSGALQIAFEKLKKKLQQEGLFDEQHKKALPAFPHCIGVVTSATGAAIRDILHVLKRRLPSIPVIIYPTLVQGAQATATIAAAIKTADARQECDILIVTRGGGSIEDLWCFNEEAVARAIFDCNIPVLTGIGHEVDFTIADFVADQRAPTPSAAAEIASPDRQEWMQRIDHLEHRLASIVKNTLQQKTQSIKSLSRTLQSLNPKTRLAHYAEKLNATQQRIFTSMRHLLQNKTQMLSATAQSLHAISPLTTLERGYAIITHKNQIVRKKTELKTGDRINARLSDGTVSCCVDKIE